MKKSLIIILGILLLVFLAFQFSKNKYPLTSIVNTPTENIKKSVSAGKPLGFSLNLPQGYQIGIFADLGRDLPRVLTFDPKGNLIASVPGNGKIIAMRDENGDGTSESQTVILSGLNKPHGIVFEGGKLYVAETDKVVKYDYDPSQFKAINPKVLFNLPGGGRHFTRTIKILNGKLYTSVGSSCDTCVDDPLRADILVSNLDGSDLKVFAKGLRNTVFFAFDPNGKIWGNDMGRDFLGDNLPPDDLNSISEGKDYGWPYCYGDKVRDAKFMPGENSNYCNGTEGPKFAYPAHVAPLGITFDKNGDILSAFHGSWNSSVPVGYKVVKLTKSGDSVAKMEDFITGFISGKNILGRPVDLIFDSKFEKLFISDDKSGLIYVVTGF